VYIRRYDNRAATAVVYLKTNEREALPDHRSAKRIADRLRSPSAMKRRARRLSGAFGC
jgi:hypothetical protein